MARTEPPMESPTAIRSILIADDDPLEREVYRRRLEETGHTVFVIDEVDSAERALRAIRERTYDCVILDDRIGPWKGLDVLREIQDPDGSSHLPVILLTENCQEDVAQEVIRAGAQDCLLKHHTSPEGLCRAIEYAMARHRAQRSAREIAVIRRRNVANLRTVIANCPDGMLVLDDAGQVIDSNPAAREMLRDQLVEGSTPAIDLSVDEQELLVGDDDPSFIHIRGVDIDWNGHGARLFALRDITASRRVADAKDRFLSHVSHELRTPLNAIYQFTTILLDGLAGELADEQRDYLGIVHRNTAQLRMMIRDLLELTRSGSGKLAIYPRQVNAVKAIHDALEPFRPTAYGAGIALAVEAEPNLPTVLADSTRLQQILTNLIDNALKFSDDRSRITVRVGMSQDDKGLLRFEVADEGCGIPPSEQARIFDHLYQVRSPHAPSRRGLGIGLHICRELVELQGGSIGVESSPGAGSTFWFELPSFSMPRLVSELRQQQSVHPRSFGLIRIDLHSVDPQIGIPEGFLGRLRSAIERYTDSDLDRLVPSMGSKGSHQHLLIVTARENPEAQQLVQTIHNHLDAIPEEAGVDFHIEIDVRVSARGSARDKDQDSEMEA